MKLIDDEIAKYERQAREAHADADETRDGFRRDFARQCEAKARQWRELRDSLRVGVPVLNKTREQWQKLDAKFCAEHNSSAANFYLIRDAQQDIERLHRALLNGGEA